MRPGAGCCCFSSPSSSGADVGPGRASQSQSTVLSQPRPAPFTSSSLSNLCIPSHFPTVHHIPFNGFYHHLCQGSEAASKWHSKSPRGVDVSAISRFLGSIPPPPPRLEARQFSGLRSAISRARGSQIGIWKRRLLSASASAIGEMARSKDPRLKLQGLNLHRQGADVLSGRRGGGPGGMAFHLSRICPSNSRSRLAHCRRRPLCFPIPPASDPVPAVPTHACDADART